MISIFNKISRLSKLVFPFLYLNIIYIKKSYTIKDKDKKYAFLNLDNRIKVDDLSRYFYTICLFLKYAGFRVIIKTQWRDFKAFRQPRDFKKLLLEQKYILVRNCSTPLNTIVLVQPNIPNHTINLFYGYHLAYQINSIIKSGKVDCIAPYSAYPLQYKYYLDPNVLPALRKSNRTMKIFFAGDTWEIRYLNAKVERFFNVIPRLELIKFILSNFENSQKLQNDSGKQMLNKLLSSEDYVNEIIVSQVKTQEQDWLKILSKTDFFICPPGARMPWCHNCIEAMSVGAIPILEYNNLFYPALENLKNCLSFSNYEELKVAIERALAMGRLEIEMMRKNVLEYHDTYLSINVILNKIKTFSNSSQQEVNIALPFIADKKEWKALKPLHPQIELDQLNGIVPIGKN